MNDRVINYTLLVSLIFAVPAIILLHVSIYKKPELDILVYTFLVLILLSLYVTRKKTTTIFRIVSFFALVFLAIIPCALDVGVLGFWIIELLVLLVLLSIFAKKKYAVLALGVVTLLIIPIALLHITGVFEIGFDVDKYAGGYKSWLAMLFLFAYVGVLTISVISMQKTFFLDSIKKSVAAKENAEFNEKKFKSIFSSSNDGILISDEKGTIIEANDSISAILGKPLERIIGAKTVDFVTEEYVDSLKNRQKVVFKGGSLPLLELLVKRENNRTIPVEVNTKKLVYNNQQVLLSIVRDVSNRIESERKILNSVIKAEERERSRFAKEIHDGVGPLLSAAKIYINAIKNVGNEEEKEYTVKKLNEIIDEAITTAKEVSNNLSPHILKNFGLNGAIESFLAKLDQSKIEIVFRSNQNERMDEDIEVTFYRVLIELVNNSLKYASANSIFIELNRYNNILSLAYLDDGKGFNLASLDMKKTGMGLANIKSRVKSLNGRVKFWSTPGSGFKADISIKLD